MCYTFPRATRGVSYCAPAYLADRLCERGRQYIRDWLNNKDSVYVADKDDNMDVDTHAQNVATALASEHWAKKDNNEVVIRHNPWDSRLDDVMFYM